MSLKCNKVLAGHGRRLKAARMAANLTQEEVGQRLGRTRQAVIAWESEDSVPDALQLAALVRLFRSRGVRASCDEIMLGEPPPSEGRRPINGLLLDLLARPGAPDPLPARG